jgi:hypothetical protein
MKTILNRFYLYFLWIGVAVLHNLIHESLHYTAARVFGEEVLEFRLLTNGWLTSQVIYATPVEQRSELYWLVIAWLPAAVTTLIGFLVYFNRAQLITRFAPLNLLIWDVGALFMIIDPLYFGVLSWFIEQTDVNAAAILGLSPIPFRILALIVCVIAIRFILRWRQEARTNLHRYRLLS